MKTKSIKNLYYLFFVVIFLAVWHIGTAEELILTKAFFQIQNISSNNSMYIYKDFCNRKGVKKCEISLVSNSVILEIDDSIVSEDDIANIFSKWGCSINNSYYSKLQNIIIE